MFSTRSYSRYIRLPGSKIQVSHSSLHFQRCLLRSGGVVVLVWLVRCYSQGMMPEQRAPNDPNESDRDRHFNRCAPELRPSLDRLDKLIQSTFPDVEVNWERAQEWVGYWIGGHGGHRHRWVAIGTNWSFLELRIRVRIEFESSPPTGPELATKLGVANVEIRTTGPPDGMKKFVVRINPDSKINFEALSQFLIMAHKSATDFWA